MSWRGRAQPKCCGHERRRARSARPRPSSARTAYHSAARPMSVPPPQSPEISPIAGNRNVRPSGATPQQFVPVPAHDADAPRPLGAGAQHREGVVAHDVLAGHSRAAEPAADPPVVLREDRRRRGSRRRGRRRVVASGSSPRRRTPRRRRSSTSRRGAAPARCRRGRVFVHARRPADARRPRRAAPRRSSSRRHPRRGSAAAASRQRAPARRHRTKRAPAAEARPRCRATASAVGSGHVCRSTTAPSPCAARAVHDVRRDLGRRSRHGSQSSSTTC